MIKKKAITFSIIKEYSFKSKEWLNIGQKLFCKSMVSPYYKHNIRKIIYLVPTFVVS